MVSEFHAQVPFDGMWIVSIPLPLGTPWSLGTNPVLPLRPLTGHERTIQLH